MGNVLIIGNGFDRALNMPTSYNDFLKFYYKARSLYNKFYGKDILAEALPEKYHDLNADLLADNKEIRCKDLFWSGIDACYRATLDSCFEMFSKLLDEFEISNSDYEKIFRVKGFREINAKLIWILTRKNFWLEYFRSSEKEQGWIDFEEAIGNLLMDMTEENYDQKLIDLLQCWNIHPDDEVVGDFLEDHLNQLKDFLEGYLIIFERARQMAKDKGVSAGIDNPFIESDAKDLANLIGTNADYVVSLNYTDTYNSVFHGRGCVEYVHGKVRNADDENENFTTSAGLVLGINNQASLKKYEWAFKEYQIKHYRISRKYLHYLHENNANIDNIIIYGCSLGIADKEVFKPIFLCYPEVKKEIYCYNYIEEKKIKKALREIIGDNALYDDQLEQKKINYTVVNKDNIKSQENY